VYTYRGVCLARDNRGPRSAFKVFNVFPDIGGFVQHFPL
jgi:ribosomal protein L19